MGDQGIMVGVRDYGCGIGSSNKKVAQQVSGVRESENLGDDLLDDLVSFWDHISGRLMISRMVSVSVIKGMVKAVEQGAEEKIAMKELEVESLKEKMHLFQLLADQSESCHGMRCEGNSFYPSFTDAFVEHDNMRKSLGSLQHVAKGQIKKLKKEICTIWGCSPIQTSSGSELVGLGGILQGKASESFTGVDNLLETLNTTLDDIYIQVDDMVYLTKASLCEWKQEQEIQKEVEALVIQSSIRSFHERYEDKLWDQNTALEKIDEVSNLRKELDAILNSLSNPENGQLISHGSHDMDQFHRRGLNNHFSPSTSLWEGNGVFEDSNNGLPESWDAAQLKHMTKDELVNYFNGTITKMRRSHESMVQQMTEEFFSLRREYLREKGSSLPLRKDKDLEFLRKKIPDVISKLDDFIVEYEKLSRLGNNTETLRSSNNRIDDLLSENRQLRDSVSDQIKEVKCLSLQVSDAAEKMMQHYLAEANLVKLIEKLKADLEDAEIETSVAEEVYKCVIRGVNPQNNHDIEELEMQHIHVPEICQIDDSDITEGINTRGQALKKLTPQQPRAKKRNLRKVFKKYDASSSHSLAKAIKREKNLSPQIETSVAEEVYKCVIRGVNPQNNHDTEELEMQHIHAPEICQIDDSDIESLFIQGLGGVIFKETIKDVQLKFDGLTKKCLDECENRASLELKAREREEELRLLIEEKERLKEEVHLLVGSLEEKEKLRVELVVALMKKKEQFDLINSELELALEQIEVDKGEIDKLDQKVELMTKEVREANEHRNMLLAIMEEKQNDILLLEAKENEQRNQMQALIVLVCGLSRELSDFECQVAERIRNCNLRLEDSNSKLSSLVRETNSLKNTALMYKKRLEKRCNDLQMAESEVDLLGDEVRALLSLLEKIYIALDHYSPIFKHYPGVIEILELVRRKLSTESTKSI